MTHPYFTDSSRNLLALVSFRGAGLWGILLVSFFASPRIVPAQSVSEVSTSAELGGFLSSSNRVPFWLRANQWGQVPLAAPAGTARVGFHYQSPRTFADTSHRKARLNWEFGAQGVVNAGIKSKVLLPQAYAKLRWKRWELMAGRDQQILGIVDTTLSSGSYSWSGNALPIPMVMVSLAEYVPLRFLGNFFSIKGSYAHGWFNESYIKRAYLHQKTFYGRFGKPEGNVHVQVGIVHNVQWGGEADYLKEANLSVDGKLTTNIKDYLLGVVLAQIPTDKSNNRFTNFDGVNRIGNHVGHYDLAVDWRIRKTKFMLYRQHPFEDASGLEFQNLPDGLYGLSLRRSEPSASFLVLKGIVLEYLYTKNQTGDAFTIPGSRFTGGDNYFNHQQYVEGWSYKGSGLGTPFIPTKYEVKEGVPLSHLHFPTNRIVLYHLGLEGLLAQKVRILLKISNSRHYTSSLTPLSDPIYRQFSSLLSVDAPLARWKNTRIKAQVAYDKGDVLPESFGGYLGIKTYFRK